MFIFALMLSIGASAQQNFESSINQVKPIPQSLRSATVNQGKVETFVYNVVRNGKSIKKHARVYVPYGYDAKNKKKRYNVVYLMHGGGDKTTSFFSDPRSPLPLTQVLDHLNAEKMMEPVIVVAPTFYDDDENIGQNGMNDAIGQCRDFHVELQNYLIPAVEKAYNTYLEGTDSVSIAKTRGHRAFGGFSMGSLCTWYQLAYGNSAVKNYIPLSGDLWIYDKAGKKQDAKTAAEYINDILSKSAYGKDFEVYAYTGTKDIAGTPEKNFIEALSLYASLFRYNKDKANLRFSMKEGGVHYYGDINEYLYYALPLIWSK